MVGLAINFIEKVRDGVWGLYWTSDDRSIAMASGKVAHTSSSK